MGSSSISSSTIAKSTITWPSVVSSNASTGTIKYATEHPITFITFNSSNYDWYYTEDSSTDNTRWITSSSAKSIYDPCPAGWSVPDNDVWSDALGSSLTFTNESLYSSTNKGMNFSGNFGADATIWYSLSGYRGYNDGALRSVRYGGNYWSASPYDNNAYSLYLSNTSSTNPLNFGHRSISYSVRCIQE